MAFEEFNKSSKTEVLPSELLKDGTRSSVTETVSKISSMKEVKNSYNTLLKQLPEKYKKLLEAFYKRNCDFCKKKITLGGISQMMFEINNFLGNFKGKDGEDSYDYVRNFCKIFYDYVNGYLDTQNMEFDLLCDLSDVKPNWAELGKKLEHEEYINDYFC